MALRAPCEPVGDIKRLVIPSRRDSGYFLGPNYPRKPISMYMHSLDFHPCRIGTTDIQPKLYRTAGPHRRISTAQPWVCFAENTTRRQSMQLTQRWGVLRVYCPSRVSTYIYMHPTPIPDSPRQDCQIWWGRRPCSSRVAAPED